MKFNFDCARDVLLAIEKLSNVNPNSFCFEGFHWSKIFDEYSEYKNIEIFYTVYHLSKAGYIVTDLDDITVESEMVVYDLTFKGHEYLNSIRDKDVWNKVKTTLKYMTFEVILHTAKHFAVNQSVNLPLFLE